MDIDSADAPAPDPAERFLGMVIDGLGDPRVSAVLAGPMFDEMKVFVRMAFPERFEKVAAGLDEPFDGFPPEVTSAPDVFAAVLAFVDEQAAQHRQTAAMAILQAVGDFVVDKREQVIAYMTAAGEGPLDDRPGRIRSAGRLIDDVRGGMDAISGAGSIDEAEAVMDELRSRLEPLRDELSDQVLDDAIVWGARPDAEEEVRDDVPALTPAGRRVDVEDLLVDSWMVEMEMHLLLAAKAGKPVTGMEVAGEDQREFVLDALVAVQEAFTLSQSPEILLKFGELRLAKGDVGEARSAAEKVMEMVGDEESPVHIRAQELYDAVTQASPLTRDRRCFVATAAMGDADAPEVDVLRTFRDEVLLPTSPGRLFVRGYYRLSPPLARFIAGNDTLRAFVRAVLIRPMAGLVSLFLRD